MPNNILTASECAEIRARAEAANERMRADMAAVSAERDVSRTELATAQAVARKLAKLVSDFEYGQLIDLYPHEGDGKTLCDNIIDWATGEVGKEQGEDSS